MKNQEIDFANTNDEQVQPKKQRKDKNRPRNKNVTKFVLCNLRADLDIPSFQMVEGTDSSVIEALTDIDLLGNEVFNPKTAQLRMEAMNEQSDPGESSQIEAADGSVSQWSSSVQFKKDLSNVKMKVYDDDGLPIDGQDYRKHMVLSSLRIKNTPEWVNPALYNHYNQQELKDRQEYSELVSEHRSQLLDECRNVQKSEEKALKDFRFKSSGESELSFNSAANKNDKNKSEQGSRLGSKFSSKLSKSKQQQNDDAMSYVSFATDFKSRYSGKSFNNNKHGMLEIINDDTQQGDDKNVIQVVETLHDNNDQLKDDDVDDFFNMIRGTDEILKDTGVNFWEDDRNNMIQKDTFGDDRDNDFDMMDVDDGVHNDKKEKKQSDDFEEENLDKNNKQDAKIKEKMLNERLNQFVKLNERFDADVNPYQNVANINLINNNDIKLVNEKPYDIENLKNEYDSLKHLLMGTELEGVDGIQMVSENEEISDEMEDIPEEEPIDDENEEDDEDSDINDIDDIENEVHSATEDLVDSIDDQDKHMSKAKVDGVSSNLKQAHLLKNLPSDLCQVKDDDSDGWQTCSDEGEERNGKNLRQSNHNHIIEDDDDQEDCTDSEEDISDEDGLDYEDEIMMADGEKKVRFSKTLQNSSNNPIANENVKPKSILKKSSTSKEPEHIEEDKKSSMSKSKSEVKSDMKNIKNEVEYENLLKEDIDECLKQFDTPSEQLDMDFFNKVKSAHQTFKQQETLAELKLLKEAAKNETVPLSKELILETDQNMLYNSCITKNNNLWHQISLDEARKYDIKDTDGKLYESIPEFNPDEECEDPKRKYKREREFDCQTIVSTQSTTDNLPKFYKIDKVEELVVRQRENDKKKEESRLSRISESMMSINSIKSTIKDAQSMLSIKRERDEDPETRKCRKEAMKAIKKENREFKKQLKEEYKKNGDDLLLAKDNLFKVGCHKV